jgi:hypothetical protein
MSPASARQSHVALAAQVRRDVEQTRAEWLESVEGWKQTSRSPLKPTHSGRTVEAEHARLQMIAARQRYENALKRFSTLVLSETSPLREEAAICGLINASDTKSR